jgi:hypothetical protein
MAPLLHRFPPIRPRLHPKLWRNQGGGVVGDPAKVPRPAPSSAGRVEANPAAKLPMSRSALPNGQGSETIVSLRMNDPC